MDIGNHFSREDPKEEKDIRGRLNHHQSHEKAWDLRDIIGHSSSGMGLIGRIDKELKQPNNQKQAIQLKRANNPNGCASKDEIQGANSYGGKAFITGETHIKTTGRC